VANRNPQLRQSIGKLIDELESDHSTLVHGDFSPKNIMVSPLGEVYILDFETLHVGNPVFDLAFLLAHLVCKFFRVEHESDRRALANLASEFVAEYEMIHPISPSLTLHTALIALARVEGKSPVNYLNPQQQEALQTLTKSILAQRTSTNILDLFQRATI
jgi:aminoglycoside phosphotransferase (APT) family kinase protein